VCNAILINIGILFICAVVGIVNTTLQLADVGSEAIPLMATSIWAGLDVPKTWSFLISPVGLSFVGGFSIFVGLSESVVAWLAKQFEADDGEWRKKPIKVLRCIGWPTFIIFLVLKASNIIHWHWFWIILPIPFVFIGFIGAVIMAVLLFLIILVVTFIIATLSK